MGVVTAPLFSLTASGTIGKALTYSRWKGIKYVRTRVIPQNPKTASQLEVRNIFSYLNDIWPYLTGNGQAPSIARSTGRPLTDRNAFIQGTATSLRGMSDLTDLILSPGQSPIPPLVGPTFTPGVGTITLAASTGNAPAGWTLDACMLVVVRDSDPQTPPYTLYAASDSDPTAPYSVVLNSLPAGDYLAAGWFFAHSTADPNVFRCGPQSSDFVTVT